MTVVAFHVAKPEFVIRFATITTPRLLRTHRQACVQKVSNTVLMRVSRYSTAPTTRDLDRRSDVTPERVAHAVVRYLRVVQW